MFNDSEWSYMTNCGYNNALTVEKNKQTECSPLNIPLIVAPTFFPFSAPFVIPVISWKGDNFVGITL